MKNELVKVETLGATQVVRDAFTSSEVVGCYPVAPAVRLCLECGMTQEDVHAAIVAGCGAEPGMYDPQHEIVSEFFTQKDADNCPRGPGRTYLARVLIRGQAQ